jgi:transcriptional regulator with XRE-family HTH domain
MAMDMDKLGKRLRERREQAGLSQAEVSRRTGIIQRDISRLEHGIKPALWADTLLRLAEALECATDYLLGRTDVPRPTPPVTRPRPRKAAPVD